MRPAGQLRNPHTRRAYGHAVRQFLTWTEGQRVGLAQLTPGLVGRSVDQLRLAVPSRKQHLAAPRACFDALVLRRVVVLNPVAPVRGERYRVVAGQTPEKPSRAQFARIGSSIKSPYFFILV